MKRALSILAFAVAAAFAFPSPAKDEPPAGATGVCKDGTYSTAHFEKGACSHHGGVKEWYDAPKTQAKRDNTGEGDGKSATGISVEKKDQDVARSDRASGGRVWVNTDSNVYHCSGDTWYGHTKKGEYMSESQARAHGARPARGKACA